MMKCEYCGELDDTNTAYCIKCGRSPHILMPNKDDKEELEYISVLKITEKKDRSWTFQVREDEVFTETSARMIVNHLIKKFDLRF